MAEKILKKLNEDQKSFYTIDKDLHSKQHTNFKSLNYDAVFGSVFEINYYIINNKNLINDNSTNNLNVNKNLINDIKYNNKTLINENRYNNKNLINN